MYSITLGGKQYSGITSVLMLRRSAPKSSSLHLYRSMNMMAVKILRGDFAHLLDLYDACKAAGILCEWGDVD